MKYTLSLLGFCCLLTACSPKAAPPVSPPVQLPKAPATEVLEEPLPDVQIAPASTAPYRLLRLERTPCYGKCPHYAVDFYSNGLVLYDGKKYAPLDGLHESRIDSVALENLQSAIAEADFFKLQERYPAQGLKDLPGTRITVTNANRQSHRVLVQFDPPTGLAALIELLDGYVDRGAFLEVR